MQTIDCHGQACPAPVIAAKKALESSPEGACVLVDDGAPRENVNRFATNRGYVVTESRTDQGWSLMISSQDNHGVATASTPAIQTGERVMLISSDRLGEGAENLGRLLMRTFLHTLLETAELPDRIIFLNSGILLATKESEALEALKTLEQLGVEIASCGVCLDFYDKKEQLAVGRITNMFSIAEQLLAAASVIRL